MLENNLALKDFLSEYGDILKKKISDNLNPLYDVNHLDEWDIRQAKRLDEFKEGRKPFEKQKAVITALTKSFLKGEHLGGFGVGEMGVGKTIIGIGVAYLLNAKRTIIMCPGHLVKKWIREIETTLPNVEVVNLNNKSLDVLIAMRHEPKPVKQTFYVIGKERAKLHYAERRAMIQHRYDQLIFYCSSCGKKYEIGDNLKENKIHVYCENESCKEALYQPSEKFRRYAKSEFIKRYLKRRFDLCIVDEVHELKGGNTAQGQAMSNLASASKKVLGLTGTLMGGYSTNLFYMLWRLSPGTMKEISDYGSPNKFAEKYGVIQRTVIRNSVHTASIGGNKSSMYVKEKPGISPLLLPHCVLDMSAFIRLNDISNTLPTYEESIINVAMAPEQEKEYFLLEERLMDAVGKALATNDKHLLGKMVNSLLGYPDGARRGEIVRDKESIIAVANSVKDYLLPKEQELIEIVRKEKEAGRKVLVLLEHTGTRDLIPDLEERFVNEDFSVTKLYASTTKPEFREEWLAKNGKDTDVLITNPRLVQTGLDLLDYPTIVFFQTGYSVFTLRQASRRSWRIGQDKPVKVFYMVYKHTMQDKALTLIASKLETALAVEGELSDKGLSALSESESSMVLAMARALIEKDNKTVETAWTNYKKKELKSELMFGSDEEVSTTTTVSTENQTTVIKNEYISRGRIYQKNGKGYAYLDNGGKMIFDSGKILWNHKSVGKYHGCTGSIGKKNINIRKNKENTFFILYEVV